MPARIGHIFATTRLAILALLALGVVAPRAVEAASFGLSPDVAMEVVDNTATVVRFDGVMPTANDFDISARNRMPWQKTNLNTQSGDGVASLANLAGGAQNEQCTYTPNAGHTFPGTDTFYYRGRVGSNWYDGGTVTVTFKSTQTITFNALPNVTYGAPSINLAVGSPQAATSAPTLTATSGPQPAQPAITYTVTGPATISGTTLTITGAGTVTVTAAQAGDANYVAATSVARTFVVAKKALTVTASNATKVYGTANPAFAVTYTGFATGDTSADLGGTLAFSTSAANGSGVGSYPITASGYTSDDYTFTYVNGSLSVTQAPLTITADNKSKVYGAAMPTLTSSISGLVNGDNAGVLSSISLTSTGTATSAAGSYTITASGGTNANYSVTYAGGTLSVSQAALVISAQNQSKVYGAGMPALTSTVSGLVNGDTIGSLGAISVTSTGSSTSAVGSYAINVSGGLNANYVVSHVPATLTVNAAPLTITAENKSKVYGATMPALTRTISGLVNGDLATALGAISISSTGSDTSGVGTYPITVSGGLNANYSVTHVSGTLTVTVAALTITANPQSKVYGAAMPALTSSVAGLVNGDTVSSLSSITATCTGDQTSDVGSYAISVSGGLNANYSVTHVGNTLTISVAPLTITANDKAKVYGATMPGFTVTVLGLVNGDSVASLSPIVMSSLGTDSSPVGTYVIAVSGGLDANYTVSHVAGTLTIGTAALTIAADNKSKIYGAVMPALTSTVTGLVNGDTVSSLSAISVTSTGGDTSAVGTYPIAASGGLNANYTVTHVAGSLTIAVAPLNITADNKSKVYGPGMPALTSTVTGLVNGDTLSSLGAISLSCTGGATSGVGTYPISVSGGLNGNYAVTHVAGTLTISAAALTITADDKSKVYGAIMPALTSTVLGLVNGDTVSSLSSISVTSTGDASSGVGTYPISASGGLSGNYTVTHVAGTLTVTVASLTIDADDKSKVYGAGMPTLTTTVTGLTNGDTVSSLAAISTSSLGDATSPVGSYVIAVSGGLNPNYTVTHLSGTLTITVAPLTVAADDQTKVYGAGMPALTSTVTGLTNGDTLSSLSAIIASTGATASSGVGAYTISVSGGLNANYSVTHQAGTLTVTPAMLVVTAASLSRAYGSSNPTLTAGLAGFVNGDNAAVVSGAPALSTTATSGSAVGSYPIAAAIGSLSAANYGFSFVGGTMTVTAVPLSITADDFTMVSGTSLPTFTATYAGFVNGDDTADLAGSLAFTVPAGAENSPGFHVITPGGQSSGNYVIGFVAGTLTVLGSQSTVPWIDPGTQGDWTFAYGADGYLIMQGQTSMPVYATHLGMSGGYGYLLSTGGTDAAHLEQISAPRIDAYDHTYGTMSYGFALAGGTHQMALYFAESEGVNRVQQVEIVDRATGVVLASTTLSNFRTGRYLVYDVSGTFDVRVTPIAGPNAILNGIFFGGSYLAHTNGSATFVAEDLVTKGDWTGAYGADGYAMMGETYAYPAGIADYEHGCWTISWPAEATGIRGLVDGAGRSTSYIEGFPTLEVGMELGTATRRLALYMVDWERVHRAQTVEIIDGVTGATLHSRAVSEFGEGIWLVYDLSGYVKIRITSSVATSAVLSGIFFGAPLAPPAGGTASFVLRDDATQGDWTMRYGADGYAMYGVAEALPGYATISYRDCWPAPWTASSADVRALEKLDGSRAAACLEGYVPMTLDLELGATSRRVAVYFLDWERVNRAQTVEILDGQSGAVIDTRSMSAFGTGSYLVYDMTGHVKIRLTKTAGPNTVLSGVFLGASRVPAVPGAAAHVRTDATSQGDWTALYGADGSSIPAGAASQPSYALKLSERGDVHTWEASTVDLRGLESGGGRIASAWQGQQFTHYLNLGSGSRQLGLYFCDWERANRTQTVEIIDGVTGAVLDSRPLSAFGEGVYLVYDVSGFIEIRLTNTGPGDAVLNGIFHGALAPAGG